jgi:ABC-type transport system substrate-binding protein
MDLIEEACPRGVMTMAMKRTLALGGALLGTAGLALGGVLAFGPRATSTRDLQIGAVATPMTTDPTVTEDPVVSGVLVGAVYPTVAQLATVTAEDSGYVLRLAGDARVSADRVTSALSRSRAAGSPWVKSALAAVDTVSTVDLRTVHIGLSHPDADLPNALAGPAGVIVAPGAGPYRIADFVPGRSLTLTRVRGSGPATIHWHFYGDSGSLGADLAAGRLDLVVPAPDVALPSGARRVDGPTGPAIVVALSPARANDQGLVDAVKSVARAVPAAVAVPDRSGQARLLLRTTNEPDVLAAAQTVRRQLAASGIALTMSVSPPDEWRQLLDAGSYDLAVGTGLDGERMGFVHYAMIVTRRIAGVPRLGDRAALDLSTVRLR